MATRKSAANLQRLPEVAGIGNQWRFAAWRDPSLMDQILHIPALVETIGNIPEKQIVSMKK